MENLLAEVKLETTVKEEITPPDPGYSVIKMSASEIRKMKEQWLAKGLDARCRKKVVFHCNNCSYMTDRKMNMERHVQVNHAVRATFCDCCALVLQTRAEFVCHMVEKHKLGFFCPICNHRSTRQASFRRHFKKHSGVKDYPCEYCKYATYNKSNLERHCRKLHKVEITLPNTLRRKRRTNSNSEESATPKNLGQPIPNIKAESQEVLSTNGFVNEDTIKKGHITKKMRCTTASPGSASNSQWQSRINFYPTLESEPTPNLVKMVDPWNVLGNEHLIKKEDSSKKPTLKKKNSSSESLKAKPKKEASKKGKCKTKKAEAFKLSRSKCQKSKLKNHKEPLHPVPIEGSLTSECNKTLPKIQLPSNYSFLSSLIEALASDPQFLASNISLNMTSDAKPNDGLEDDYNISESQLRAIQYHPNPAVFNPMCTSDLATVINTVAKGCDVQPFFNVVDKNCDNVQSDPSCSTSEIVSVPLLQQRDVSSHDELPSTASALISPERANSSSVDNTQLLHPGTESSSNSQTDVESLLFLDEDSLHIPTKDLSNLAHFNFKTYGISDHTNLLSHISLKSDPSESSESAKLNYDLDGYINTVSPDNNVLLAGTSPVPSLCNYDLSKSHYVNPDSPANDELLLSNSSLASSSVQALVSIRDSDSSNSSSRCTSNEVNSPTFVAKSNSDNDAYLHYNDLSSSSTDFQGIEAHEDEGLTNLYDRVNSSDELARAQEPQLPNSVCHLLYNNAPLGSNLIDISTIYTVL